MSSQVKQIIRQTVSEMLVDSMSTQNIRRMAEKHAEKVHFVPIRYRIIGGILQGLKIKFGNFIEQLLRNIVEMDTGVKFGLTLERKSDFSLPLKRTLG